MVVLLQYSTCFVTMYIFSGVHYLNNIVVINNYSIIALLFLYRKCKVIMCAGKSFEALLNPSEALDLLLNLTPDSPDLCSSRPIKVMKPATFAVANKVFRKIADLKADDLGVWEHKKKPIQSYKVSRLPSGEVYGAELVEETGEDVYQLVRIYYHHKHTPTFCQTLFYALGMFKYLVL